MRKFLITIIIILCSITMVACTDENAPSIESISINSEALADYYEIGSFNMDELKLTIIFDDGTIIDNLELSRDMISSEDLLKLDIVGSHTIHFSYESYAGFFILNIVDISRVNSEINTRLNSIFQNTVESGDISITTYEDWISSIVGTDDEPVYLLYKTAYPEYTKTFDEWIDDILNTELFLADTWNVSLNYNDGTSEIDISQVDDYSTYANPVEPTRVGYTFSGWYFDETEFDFSQQIDKDIVITAQWAPNEYEVTFIDSLNETSNTMTYTYGVTYSFPSVTPSEEKNFIGWHTNTLEHIDNGMWLIPENITLYAQWENKSTYVNVLDTLPNEQIEITFWHVYGQSKSALLDDMIYNFNLMYPNITVISTSQQSYNDLNNKVLLSIATGTNPNLVLGYTDSMLEYLETESILPLDSFISDNNWGVDIDDFISSYVDENTQYENGYMYSFPFSKSTEMMVYNKSKFEANGITVPTDGVITWAMLDTWAETMVGSGENQCDYLINYDSPYTLFINTANQWNVPFTNSDGEILINNENTIAMLEFLQARFNNNTLAIPLAWNQNYGSSHFINEDVCMTVGSTAGVNYNIPSDSAFEVGIAPIPQYDLEHKSVTQQGPNIAIMRNSSDAERLASWLFIKYLTNTENTSRWSTYTAYLPVRYSSYNTERIINFFNMTNEDLPDYYTSQSVFSGYSQIEYFRYPQTFISPINSDDVRIKAQDCIIAIYSGTDVQDAVDDMIAQLEVQE